MLLWSKAVLRKHASLTDEKAASGAWMDVFEKRGDKWVIIHSQSAKLQSAC
jgi:hypothetical protein